jgi:hypothetical protein
MLATVPVTCVKLWTPKMRNKTQAAHQAGTTNENDDARAQQLQIGAMGVLFAMRPRFV